MDSVVGFEGVELIGFEGGFCVGGSMGCSDCCGGC